MIRRKITSKQERVSTGGEKVRGGRKRGREARQ